LWFIITASWAADFSFDITNNSGSDWNAGVVAVMPEAGSPNALISMGPTPITSPEDHTYSYADSSCDPGGEDDGDAALLIQRWGLTEGVDAWIVPPLMSGETTTMDISAQPGQVMSMVARVDLSDDDLVIAHSVEDLMDSTIDLFNEAGLPLFSVRFDISGFDANATDLFDGDGASCIPDCPVDPALDCYVALGNGTTGAKAGGSQSPAAEPDFGVFPGWALEPQDWYANGVGSPSVINRKLHGEGYIMLFETRLAQTDPACPVGMWGIGLAESTNGWDWTVQPSPLIAPTPGTFHSCVAAHPELVLDEHGTDLHVFFKGEQGTDACDAASPPWGCGRYTGVGYVKIDGNTGQFLEQPVHPIVAESEVFGYPSVVTIDGEWQMLLATYPEFYRASASAPEGPWTVDPVPVIQPGVTAWSQSEVFNPSMVCEGDQALPVYTLRNFFGGRSANGLWGPILEAGLGEAISITGRTWFISASPFGFNAEGSWRHWDAVRVQSEILIWYSEQGVDGRNHIGLAASTDQWSAADISTAHCPQPTWWF